MENAVYNVRVVMICVDAATLRNTPGNNLTETAQPRKGIVLTKRVVVFRTSYRKKLQKCHKY